MQNNNHISDEQRELLTAYLAGELAGAERDEVEQLVRHNPSAAKELESLRRTWELLDVLEAPEPSDGFVRRVGERARASDRPAYRRVMAWTSAVAAVAAGFLMAVVLWRQFAEPTPPVHTQEPVQIAEQDRRFVQDLVQVRTLYDELVRDRQDRVDVAKELAFLEELDKAGIFDEEDRGSSL